MDSLPLNDVFEFFYSIFSSIFNFINSNSLVKWFVFVPIATVFLLVIFYFVFDVSHLLDDYKAKNTMLYKGMKNYDKQQAAQRKFNKKQPTVKYGEFKKNSDGVGYKGKEKLTANSNYEDKVAYVKSQPLHESNKRLDNYYKNQSAQREARQRFNEKHNNVFDIEVED